MRRSGVGVLLGLLVLALSVAPSDAERQEAAVGLTFQNFHYTPGGNYFTVPEGVYYLAVDARGGHGGGNYTHSPAGGAAGVIDTVLPVSPGQKLQIYPGDYGGTHGGDGYSSGGAGGKVWSHSGAWDGDGGGGSTGIATGPDYENTLLVAGGGGGAGGDDTQQAWGGKGGYGGHPAQGGLDGHFQGGGPNNVGRVGGCGGCASNPFGVAGQGTGFLDGSGGGGGGGGGGWAGGGGGESGRYDTGNSPQVASVGGSGGGGGSSWVTGTALNTKYTVSAVACNGGSQAVIECEGVVTLTWGQAPQAIAIASGDGQTATVTADFAPIAVKVTDATGIPVTGVSVDFTLPVSGPSGTFPGSAKRISVSTGPLGVATVPRLTANGISGSWTAEAEVAGLTHKARFSLTNRPADSSTTIAAAPNPSYFGEGVAFSAHVSSAAPALTPDGLVQFSLDSVPVGYPVPVNSGGKAILPDTDVPVLAPGSHVVEARYLGDEGHSGSSDTVNQVVQRIATAVTAEAEPNPSSVGQQVTLRAEIMGAPAPTGNPSGSVEFTDGPDSLGTASVGSGGIAELITDDLALGSTRVEAAYSGDSAYLPGTGSFIASVGPEASATLVSSSSNPAVWGSPVSWQATVRRSDQGQVLSGTIGFSLDGDLICPAAPISSSGTVTCSSPNPPEAGIHAVEADYLPPTGSADLPSQGTVTQLVTKARTVTSIAVDPEPSVFGRPAELDIAVTAVTPGAVSGQIDLSIDGNPAGSVDLPAGGRTTVEQACFAVSGVCPFRPGSHALEALFSPGGTNLYPSHGVTVHRVGPADTAVTLTSSRNPVPQNEPLTLAASVTGPENLGSPGGRVQFLIDGQAAGEAVALSGGAARSLPIDGLSQGDHRVAARFIGTDGFAPAEVDANQTVGPPEQDFGTPTLGFHGKRARISRNGNTWLRATCHGEPGAVCRLRAVLRTSRPAKVKRRHGSGSVKLASGTALAVRVIRLGTGRRKAVRFDLSNLGGRIIDRNPRIPARVRATPDPGTAQMPPHTFRLYGSRAPAFKVGRSARATRHRLRLRVRCRGGDGRACAGPVTVRAHGGKLLARKRVRRGQGRGRKLILRLRSGSRWPAKVRVKAKSKIRVGRNTKSSRWVRVR